MANFSIFGERVPRLRKPSQSLPLCVDRYGNNKAVAIVPPTIIQPKKPLNELEAKRLSILSKNQLSEKKIVRRKVVRRVKKTVLPIDPIPGYKPKVIPNLPDKILWYIFDLLDYKNQCKAECINRHWQRLIRNKQKREIKELSVEMLGSSIEILQQKSFKRLSITCPNDSFDFLSGVIRRSHTLLNVLTCDFGLLANASKLAFETEGRWKYFSGVEQLWLLITKCPANLLQSFSKIEANLFTELTNLTIQIHSNDDLENVGELVEMLVKRHTNSELDIELHADRSSKILQIIDHLKNLQLNRLKIVCSALDAAPLSLTALVERFQQSQIKFKKIVFLEWYLNFDQNTPIVTQPVQLLHINSCSINRSKEMVGSLYKTMTQKRKRSASTPKQPIEDKENSNTGTTKVAKPTKKVVRKKIQYIKKIEMAGAINCSDLLFLASKQHVELEEQISRKIPNLNIDTSEIYYFE